MTSTQYVFEDKADQERLIYFASDVHDDSPHYDEEAELAMLEEVRKNNATLIRGGDNWDLIVPNDLKRYSGSHAEGVIDAYLDQKVKRTFKRLEPYADHIAAIGMGNHETAFLKRHYSDAANRLREMLNGVRSPGLPPIRHLGYRGFMRFTFKATRDNRYATDVGYFHHGRGAAAVVTRGTIDFQRVRADIESVDWIWLQHKHVDTSDIPRKIGVNPRTGRIWTKQITTFFTAGFSADVVQREHEEHGYILDWPEEQFYGTQSRGYAILHYSVRSGNKGIRLRRTLLKPAEAGEQPARRA